MPRKKPPTDTPADPPAGNQAAVAVLRIETLKTRIEHLVQLKRAADEAATDYKEAIVKTAADARCIPAVVRRFVTARAGERFIEKKQEVEQLSLLFEEIGG
jgi:hypothetical protein